MIRRSLITIAAVILGLSALPAFAGHCPADIAAIDSALENVSLEPEVAERVKALRDEGQSLHDAGKHGESVDTLSEAMRLVLNHL